MRKTIRFLLAIGLVLLLAPFMRVNAQTSLDGYISSGGTSSYESNGLLGSIGEPVNGLLRQDWQHLLQGFAYKTLEAEIATSNDDILILAKPVKLFPNPVDEFLNIQYDGLITGNELYSINDISGRVVRTGKLLGPLTQLNAVALRPGAYVFSLTNVATNKQIYISKFVKLK